MIVFYFAQNFCCTKHPFIFQILNLLDQLHSVDQELQSSNFVVDVTKTYKETKLKVIIAITLASLLLVFVIIFNAETYNPSYMNVNVFGDYVTYCMPLICTSYMLLQFCTFLVILKQRYTWLNNKITNIAVLCSEQLAEKQNHRFGFLGSRSSAYVISLIVKKTL